MACEIPGAQGIFDMLARRNKAYKMNDEKIKMSLREELENLIKEWRIDSPMYSGPDGLKDCFPMSAKEGEEWARALCAAELEDLLK